MSKEMTRTATNAVGATSSRPHFEGKTQKGITLIALIITIIVMLILVGVTVTVALNGGLFSSAQDATANTESEKQKEQTLASGQIEVDGKKYETYQDYLDKNPLSDLPEGVKLLKYDELEQQAETDETVANIKAAVDAGKVTAVLQETITLGEDQIVARAVVPTGFEISTVPEERSISGGLVIKDSNNNEFVWIPVKADFDSSFSTDGYNEPEYLTDDVVRRPSFGYTNCFESILWKLLLYNRPKFSR